jgi:hypothetical protein
MTRYRWQLSMVLPTLLRQRRLATVAADAKATLRAEQSGSAAVEHYGEWRRHEMGTRRKNIFTSSTRPGRRRTSAAPHATIASDAAAVAAWHYSNRAATVFLVFKNDETWHAD